MAAYLDPAALRLVFGSQLNGSPTVDYTGTAGQLSDAELTDAIDEAQTEVDGRLAARYGQLLPFSTPPKLVVNVTRDIAAYLATLTYRKGAPIPPGDPILLRYTRAEQLLTGAATGTIDLPTPDGTTGSEEAAASTVAVVNPLVGDLWNLADFGLGILPAGLRDPFGPYGCR